MKSIFGNEKEKSVLLSFLNSAIKSESPLVDVELRNVEIQLRNEYNMPKRTLYYWSKLYSEQLKEGENYLNLNRTICINILNFIQFKETKSYHSVFKIIEEKEKLYVISSDEDEREKYRMREKARLDAASALATAELKGKAEGERLAKLSIARSLLGIIPNELIAEKTGLSLRLQL